MKVIDLRDVEGIYICNESMSCLYRNNVLIWKKTQNTFDGYPEFIASSLTAGSYYTDDGKVWKTTSVLRRLKFTCIEFSNDIAVAGTSGTYSYKSEDGGRTWKAYPTLISGRMTSIAFGNGIALMSSIDSGSSVGNVWYTQYDQTGSTWRKQEDYHGPNIAGLAFCGTGELQAGFGQFFAGTENGIWTMEQYSTDGTTWQKVNDILLNNKLWENILYSKKKNGIIVASSMHNAAGNAGGIVYSEDAGHTWKKAIVYKSYNGYSRNTISDRFDSEDGSWKTLSYGNGLFIAGSVGGSFVGTIVSSDGKKWYATGDTTPWNAIQYGNGLFVGAVSKTSRDGEEQTLGLMYSSDGIEWQSSNITGSEFCVVEHVDKDESSFLTGTMLKYSATNNEKIKSVKISDADDDAKVSLMF